VNIPTTANMHSFAIAHAPLVASALRLPRWAFLLWLVFSGSAAWAQPQLPRRVFLGIRMENLTDEKRQAMELGAVPAVLLGEVLPGGSAAVAGWQRGDLLAELHGTPVGSTAEVMAELAKHQVGQSIPYRLVRGKKSIKGKLTLLPWPEEHYADLHVAYTAHPTVNGVQRAITTRPKAKAAGRLPLAVFIGGISCYSLDAPLDTGRGELQLMNRLSRMGYACARLEKPGVGDAAVACTPCSEVSFMNEMAGYAEMIRQLKRLPGIDSTDVTLIGHSMGGVFAPLVAKLTPVQRIVAYGTIGSNFPEYLAKTRRTIGEANGWDAERTDAYIKDFCECAVWYLADGLTTAQAAAKKPACQEYMEVFDLRSRTYINELYALSIPAAWKDYRGSTLLLWGEADFISARHDHELLRDMLQAENPGSATFTVVPDADHGMDQADDFKAAVAASGPYQPGVGKVIADWMQRR